LLVLNFFSGRRSRRAFLKVGAFGLGGLCGFSLADVLRLEAKETGSRDASGKSVIMVYLPGGPSHIDMFDMKPAAPVEIRGEFLPIRSNVPGLDICELLPRLSRMADKYSIIRGFQTPGGHDASEVTTGFRAGLNRPAFGSVVSRIHENRRAGLPEYVTLIDESNLPFGQEPTYLGQAHRPFAIQGPGLANLTLAQGIQVDRLEDRSSLLRSLDLLNRAQDSRGELAAMDAFTARALEIISSHKTREAFDVTQETQAAREMYGLDPASTHFLQARRLVEAGVKVVTLCGGWVEQGQSPANLSNWDTHDNNFPRVREQLPFFDRALSALITDLHQRGLNNDVVVVACGEMGRAPRVGVPNEGSNATASGRDHWPIGFCWISGGGLQMGQVIGETDRHGGSSTGGPVTVQNLLATLYYVLGIDPTRTFTDHRGRPQFLLSDPQKIETLI
jgi:hypothetical protein